MSPFALTKRHVVVKDIILVHPDGASIECVDDAVDLVGIVYISK